MIFYFLKEEGDEVGPLTFDQLKCRPVKSDTKVWFAGLEEWTTVEQVHELKELFTTNTSRSAFSRSKVGKLIERFFKKKKKPNTYRASLNKEAKNLN